MNKLAFLLLAAVACTREPVVTETMDTRQPIGVWYVGAPELEVRGKAADDAPVVTKYLSGESVSVLARNGEWAEVRTAMGSGWVHFADLTTAETAKKEEDSPTPRFRKAPNPVTAPSARGEIFIEADVNTDGEITNARILVNTTGNPDLAQKNVGALQQAKFYPIVIKGERKRFKYDYRVTY
ncbi:MAG TPA: SH3 domain-containing protein [Thermoanaerobaculia bacterium]|nr:SH3 domain-containing protein [Thermoanaerobaculia bacterium]